LGGPSGAYLSAGQWQIGLAYRMLTANQWFVGTEVREDKAPFGQPLFLNIHSVDLTVNYAATQRLSLTVNFPFSSGSHSRYYADGVRHKVEARGLGDVSLFGNYWILEPQTHSNGNVFVSLGVKMPTGKNEVTDDFFLANGSVAQRPVDQSIQLGDGGWGILFQTQAYRTLTGNLSGYLSGSYLASLREKTDVPSPTPGVTLSVPDVYSARLGLTYGLLSGSAGDLSVSLGGRVEGIPLHDLVGGSDGFRRPITVLYIDPGVTLGNGANSLFANVPVRVHADFHRSLVDRRLGLAGGGDLAKYLIFVGVDHRF
jgi:hypothetical protein